MRKKILLIIMLVLCFIFFTKGVYAASASITASKKSVTVGTKVTITVNVNAAAWNLNVSGATSGSIVGFNAEAENQSTTKTYTFTPSKAGTYSVTLSGDITDENSESATNINKTVSITVKAKTTSTDSNKDTSSNKNQTTVTNTNTNTQNSTPAKKSSNANISKLTLSVEGLSFKSNQTEYNIKVGEDVNSIVVGVTLAHKKATYSISGNKDLKAGNNLIKIIVTAEDGTKKTYKINVNKAGNLEDTSAELTNLIIEDMVFDTQFVSTQTEYNGSKMKYVEKLNILPYTVSEKAKYEIIGNENLKEGENTIIVKVTSYDGTNTMEYKVNFEMMAKEEVNALQVVSPNVDSEVKQEAEEKTFKDILIEHSTIILLYVLALVEFAQVIYLYVQLKQVNPDAVAVRRGKTK